MDLGRFGLTEIPDEILKLSSILKMLNLSDIYRKDFNIDNPYILSENANLKFGSNQFREDDLKSHKIFQNLTNLEKISCYNVHPIPFSINKIIEIKSVTWLDFSEVVLTESILENFPKLKSLALFQTFNSNSSNYWIKKLVDVISRSIEELDLSCNQISAEGITPLEIFKNLS